MFARCPTVSFKKSIDGVRELVSDGVFRCSADEGVNLEAMDSSHVSLVKLDLPPSWFTEFRCVEPRALGIKLGALGSILKCGGNDDELTLVHCHEGIVLHITHESLKADRVSEFDLKLMDIECDQMGIPDVEYAVVIDLPSSEFQRLVRDLGVLGDTVVLSIADSGGVKASVEGEIGSGSVTMQTSDTVSVQVTKSVRASFALKYLQMFAKASNLSANVSLAYSDSMPLRVRYDLGNGGSLQFYLAPKLNDE